MSLTRTTFEQRCKILGNPHPFMLADGTVAPLWETRIIAQILFPASLPLAWDLARQVHSTKVHRLIGPFLQAAIAEVYADREVWMTIGDWGGCYEFRTNRRNADELSCHAHAAAIDWNVRKNPQGKPPNQHPRLPEIMERHGFLWGGTFKGRAVDGMHFEASAELLGRFV